MSDPTLPAPSRIRLRFTRAAGVWVAVGVILGIVGWYKSINLLLLLGYSMGPLLVVNGAYAWRMATRLSATRRPSREVFPGEVVEVATEVFNESRGAVIARITDEAIGQRAAWMLAPLPALSKQTLSIRWSFPLRGRHPIGPLVVDSSYPFGFLHAYRELAPAGEVVVLPAVGRIDKEMFRRWLIRGGSSDGQTRRLTHRSAAGSGDVRGLRPYRPGDSPRDVHWRTSARRGQLLVREYDRSEPLSLVIVVDPWLAATKGESAWRKEKAFDLARTIGIPQSVRATPSHRLEWALSLATSLGLAWAESDDQTDLTLIVPGEPPFVRTGRGTPGFVRTTFAALAGLRGESSVPQIAPELARTGSRRSARVIVSSRPNSPLADSFRRVNLPFAAIDPTQQPAWFTPPPALAR